MISGDRFNTIFSLFLTLALGTVFTGLQVLEYYEAPFTIADSAFGSTFFLATGFHGFHVFVGTTFLFVCFFRILDHHFTKHHHNGFEAAI
jgi:cytochrome c oxidase subunit 3|tara:strand:+ start:7259 stop:7528 length:270 start_codon:yes stop_codon:yes gene_type:complete